jgi:hypothetical protein
MKLPHSVLLRLGNVSDKRRRENKKTRMFSNIFKEKYGTAIQATDAI